MGVSASLAYLLVCGVKSQYFGYSLRVKFPLVFIH